MKDENREYFEYLKTRSNLALLYRTKFLYPKLKGRLQGKILDYGCGIGDMLRFLDNATGVDVNEYCVNFCNDIGLNAQLVRNNKIPFKDSSFDTVVMDNVLEHISEPIGCIREIKRVLKNNGVVLIGVPGILGFSEDKDHKIFYNKNNLQNLMCDMMEFELVEWFSTPLLLSFPHKALLKILFIWIV